MIVNIRYAVVQLNNAVEKYILGVVIDVVCDAFVFDGIVSRFVFVVLVAVLSSAHIEEFAENKDNNDDVDNDEVEHLL